MTEYTLEQMKENRRLWVEALRSGKYKQGQGLLRSSDDRYCCLGVLCDVAGLEWERNSPDTAYAAGGGGACTAPTKAKAFVGLADSIGSFALRKSNALTSRNDAGASFAEIADLIESNPPGLFIDSMKDAQ